MNRQKLTSFILSISLLAGVGLGWVNRYNIWDWYRLNNYTAPSRIEEIAQNITLTDYGKQLFYAYHPELNDSSEFNQKCTIAEHSIILGCFIDRGGIYIFDVSDPRLDGVHEVTAAHEVLHAAYARLSSSEKQKIDKLIMSVFDNLKDPRIIETINSYKQRDPSVVSNELHSILATEVRELPEELEAYYKKYFKNRIAIVEYSEKYEAAFSERKKQVEQYDKQIESLKRQIEQKQARLRELEKQLNSEKQRLDALLTAKRYDEYNASVDSYNSLGRTYTATANEINRLIDEHNRIVGLRNEIASEENELIEAINSKSEPLDTR